MKGWMLKTFRVVLVLGLLGGAVGCDGDEASEGEGEGEGGGEGEGEGGSEGEGEGGGEGEGEGAACLGPPTFERPAGYASITIAVDDRANRTYREGELLWNASLRYDLGTNEAVYSSSWLPTEGPFPVLYDDGPIACGGHEAPDGVAGDGIFSVEVYVDAREKELVFEYGIINDRSNWIWEGRNGKVTVPQGSTDVIPAPGLLIRAFGRCDLRLTLDLRHLDPALGLDSSLFESVLLKGSPLTDWDCTLLLDNGERGDATASDQLVTYQQSQRLTRHTGLLSRGRHAQFVFAFTFSEDQQCRDALEYKISSANALPAGVPTLSELTEADRVFTYASPEGVKAEVRLPDGQWAEAVVALEKDSRGSSWNTTVVLPDDAACDLASEGEGEGAEGEGEGAEGEGEGAEGEGEGAEGEGEGAEGEGEGAEGEGEGAEGEGEGAEGEGEGDPVGPCDTLNVLMVIPAIGDTAGDEEIVVHGGPFTEDAWVEFLPGPNPTKIGLAGEGQQLRVRTVAHAEGKVDVRVRQRDGRCGIFLQGFTFWPKEHCPELDSLTPTRGRPEGGDRVSLKGRHLLADGLAVFFGDDPASRCSTAADGQSVDCDTPPHSPGVVDVKVVSAGCEDTLPAAYTYEPPLPDWVGSLWLNEANELQGMVGAPTDTVYFQVWEDGITPPPGEPAGGAVVAQVGYGAPGSDPAGEGWTWFEARWNVQQANNDEFAGSLVPTAAGTFDVMGRASIDGGVNFRVSDTRGKLVVQARPDGPFISALQPDRGPMAGGNEVLIRGGGFTGAQVTFGGVTIVQPTIAADTITVVAPPHEAGPVEVRVEVAGKPAATRTYTYLGPVVDGVLDDWPAAWLDRTTAEAPDWGASLNELRRFGARVVAGTLLIGIEGFVEETNALVGYVDLDPTGGNGISPHELTDRAAVDLDHALSGLLEIGGALGTARPDLGFGVFGHARSVSGASLDPLVGWRRLQAAEPANLHWVTGEVAATAAACEAAIPLATLFNVEPAQVPAAGKLTLFLRITNQDGTAYSTMELPAQDAPSPVTAVYEVVWP